MYNIYRIQAAIFGDFRLIVIARRQPCCFLCTENLSKLSRLNVHAFFTEQIFVKSSNLTQTILLVLSSRIVMNWRKSARKKRQGLCIAQPSQKHRGFRFPRTIVATNCESLTHSQVRVFALSVVAPPSQHKRFAGLHCEQDEGYGKDSRPLHPLYLCWFLAFILL